MRLLWAAAAGALGNSTAYWVGRRAALVHEVFGADTLPARRGT